MCARPLFTEPPPYRLIVSCTGTVSQGICLRLRLETRVPLQFAYGLRTLSRMVSVRATPRVYIAIEGLYLLQPGTPGNAPATAVYEGRLPIGMDRCWCVLTAGRQRQSLLFHFTPPQVQLFRYCLIGAPIVELFLP